MKIKYLILFLLLYNIGFSQSDNITGRCVGTGDPTVFYPTINQLIECSVFQDTTNGNIYDYKINQWILRSVSGIDKYTTVVFNYTELESYTGSDSIIVLQNDIYGGTFILDNSEAKNGNNYGIVRQDVMGRNWRRAFVTDFVLVDWWVENEATDGSLDVSVFIQDAHDYFESNQFKGLKFSDKSIYLISTQLDFSMPGLGSLGGFKYYSKGAELRLDPASSIESILKIGNGGPYTIEGLVFRGKSSAYNADGYGILVDGGAASFLAIRDCYFINFNSSAIYAREVAGSSGNIFEGLNIESCVFRDQVYDANTTEQAAIYLGNVSEYHRITNCYFRNCVSAVRSKGSANTIVADCIMGDFTGPLVSAGIDTTRAVIYLDTITGGTNNGKFLIKNNQINHISTGQVPLFCRVTPSINKNNSIQIIGNNFLSNNRWPEIVLSEVDEAIITGNHLRGTNSGADQGAIWLVNSDDATIDNNSVTGGRYVVKLIGGSDNLNYGQNSFESGLSSFSEIGNLAEGSLKPFYIQDQSNLPPVPDTETFGFTVVNGVTYYFFNGTWIPLGTSAATTVTGATSANAEANAVTAGITSGSVYIWDDGAANHVMIKK